MATVSDVGFVHYIPVATTIIAAAFAFSLFRRYMQRPTPHLLWWAAGVAFYGLGTLIEATITLTGNSVFLTKAWYIAGAILGGYPLAQGSLFFSHSRRFARRATALSLPFVVVASALVMLSPVVMANLEPHRPSGAILEWRWVRWLTPFINTYAAFFLIGGAAMSAWRYAKQEHSGSRALGNALIATGAILPGIGGSMAKAGLVEALYVGEFIGLILIWIGERTCAWRPVPVAVRVRGGEVVAGLALVLLMSSAGTAEAASVVGTASDGTGGRLPGATVTLHNVATGAKTAQPADGEGRFRFDGLPAGIYRVGVSLSGFSDDTKTVTIADPTQSMELSFVLWPGGLSSEVTVTALRNQRDEQMVPLRVDTLGREQLAAKNPTSTGDAMIQAPGITPVGNGPFQVRPRLRGLDSSRLLVLVDGERLNNARVATDRAGVEVSLADLGSVESMEVVSGSGSVLYGTDALSGTIDIATNQPRLSDSLRFSYGFDGYFSSNEQGGRGAVAFGVSHPRYAVQVVGGVESFDDYKAGGDATTEDSRPLYAQGILTQADTIDDNFGFDFNAFPDPFNAPYVRTSTVVPTSGAEGNNLNVSGLFAVTGTQSLRVKYIRRRMENVGFPDFAQPYFFSRVTLPYSNFDRFSARYEVQGLTPWFTNLKVSGYVQDQKRLLRNEFPVQFPVPSPRFFPINVFRLDLVTDNEQHVFTPGFDVQGTFLFARSHVVTAGTTLYQDRSQDSRTNITQTSIIGNVALGARGPVATVFPTPVVAGPATITNPVRVPDSQFRDLGVFVQDEWQVNRSLRVVAGLRVDGYRVNVDATPGYDVESLIVGAKPPVDPETLPSVAGDSVSRTALTGDVGAVFRLTDAVNLVAHYGRSYRHPNLEELLFSGPATVGAIVPNVTVEPETGHNVDVGIKWRSARYAASLAYFNNTYDGFISTEIVAMTPSGPISQAINFADVRIQGIETSGEVPFELGPGVVTLFGNAAWTRGTVLEGTSPVSGESLAGTPQDNISPFKAIAGVRWADRQNRYWMEYGARVQTEVDRVAKTLVESPYLIAQDLYGLQGFTIQRLACGVNFGPQSGRLGLVFAVENLTDAFYREQFQFAPARGRSFTVGLNVRGM